MKKFLVITTINEPTDAIKLFSLFETWQVVVVGDKKTPKDWKWDNVVYLSCDDQKEFGFELPWNNYVRKMIGYLYAIEKGAEVIAETDDDNFPYVNWDFPEDGEHDVLSGEGIENVYRFFCNDHVWPRGYPLRLIGKGLPIEISHQDIKVGVWQGLANDDPDVDAIYRMVGEESSITFCKRPPIVLNKGLASPFNSQNTLFKKEMFPLLYLPATVNQRFADILRGYVAQPIMWASGYHLGITQATVYQERNEHDLMKDFKDEIPCYLQSERAYNIIKETASSDHSIEDNLMNVYGGLEKAGIVQYEELDYLCEWLDLIGDKR